MTSWSLVGCETVCVLGHPWDNEPNVALSVENAPGPTRPRTSVRDRGVMTSLYKAHRGWPRLTSWPALLVNLALRHRQTSIDYTPIMRPLNFALPHPKHLPAAPAPSRLWRQTRSRTVRLITSRWRNAMDANSRKLMTLIITCDVR